MKKIVILIGIFLMIASCNWHNIPKIEFKVDKVEIVVQWRNSPIFEVSLSSNENILHYYYDTRAVNSYLFCPLSSQDFSAENISEESYVAEDYYRGVLFQESKVIFEKGEYHYKIPLTFMKRNINNISEQLLKEQEIKNIIDGKNCVSCIIVLAYMHKSIYKSVPFCIPTDSILVHLK